jgi:hypothetical protein
MPIRPPSSRLITNVAAPGTAIGAEVGPVGNGAGGAGIAALARWLAGVLDVDEQASAVRRHGYPRDFASGGGR